MTPLDEKRHNVRAVFSAQARVKILDAEQSKKIQAFENQLKRGRAPADTPAGSALASTEVTAILGPVLARIDEKLDRILSFLEKQAGMEEQENLIVEDTVDISGSGVCLILNGSAEKGKIVEIELEVPGFPLNRLNLFGKITRVAPHQKGRGNLFEVGIEFLNLNDQDREKLIAFSFSEQRKQIRNLKR